jgi:hypothetical protein
MQANTRKTTSLLKKFFRNELGMTISVRTEKYSMGSSLNISYTLGASDNYVSSIVNCLQHGSFDGMIDLYEYREVPDFKVDGYVLETQKYVFVRQELPEPLRVAMANAIRNDFWSQLPEPTVDNFCENWDMETYNQVMDWNWSQFFHKNVKSSNRNFNTQDYEKVTILEAKNDPDNYGYYFTYTISGVEGVFDTRSYQVIKPKVKSSQKASKAVTEDSKVDVQLVDYTEKSVVVIGDTYPIRKDLKSIGGRFNKWLTIDGEKVAGWVFSKNKKEEVENFLGC